MSGYTPQDIATARELHPWTAGGAGVLGFGTSLAAGGGLGTMLAKGALKVGAKQTTASLLGKTASSLLLPPVAATKVAGKITGKAAAGLNLATTAGREAVTKTQLAKMAGAVAIGEGTGAALEGVYHGLGRTVVAPIISEEEIGAPDEIADAVIHDSMLFGGLGGTMGAGFTAMGNWTAPAVKTLSERVNAPLGKFWADKLDKVTVALGTIETPEEVLKFLKRTR